MFATIPYALAGPSRASTLGATPPSRDQVPEPSTSSDAPRTRSAGAHRPAAKATSRRAGPTGSSGALATQITQAKTGATNTNVPLMPTATANSRPPISALLAERGVETRTMNAKSSKRSDGTSGIATRLRLSRSGWKARISSDTRSAGPLTRRRSMKSVITMIRPPLAAPRIRAVAVPTPKRANMPAEDA